LIAQNDESKKAYFEEMEEVLLRLEDVLNKYSEGRDFFGGEKIGFLDIGFGCYLGWLRVTEKMIGKKVLDETKTPALVKWAEAFAAHPAVKGNLPETDKLLEFAKGLVQRMVAAAPPK
jgi:glutathione S-transferase